MRGVYIHIPFCNQICSYCDFPKFLANEKYYQPYLESLTKEIKKRYQKDQVSTIYIGGGTPSTLDSKTLEQLFKTIKKFKVSKNLEYTIECNISDLTIEKIKLFKKYNINRISIGVQTLNQRLLKLLNRNHTFEELKSKVKLLQDHYINNISFDLIYAIPTQNLEDLKEDLQQLLSLKPNHISAYSLIIEPHTLLHIKEYKPISEDLDHAMYEYIRIFLKGKGYHQYEISNYSKASYESKHNLLYWQHQEYYGFGLGATSYIDKTITSNTKSLNDYLKYQTVINKQKLTLKEEMTYFMILGLRTKRGVSKTEFKNRFGLDIEKIFDLSNLILNGEYYAISEKDFYISNNILTKFIL